MEIIVAIAINWYSIGNKHILEVECGTRKYQWVMDEKEFNTKKDNDYIEWFDKIRNKCEGKKQ